MTSTMNKFMSAMEGAVGTLAKKCSGEKGSDMYTMYGLGDMGKEAQGALMAAFSGITDQASNENVVEFAEHCMATIKIQNLTEKDDVGNAEEARRACFCADLVVLAFQIRNIRENGKGRRDQFHAFYLTLAKYWPDEMLLLLPEIKEHGYWKDLNKYFEMHHSGQNFNGYQLNQLADQCYSLYAEQLNTDRAKLDSWQERKRQAAAKKEAAAASSVKKTI